MKNFVLVICLIFCVGLAGCSSMRSPNSLSKSQKSANKTKKANKDSDKDETEDVPEKFVRFKDTLTVVLPPVVTKGKIEGLETELDKAVILFENKEFEKACEQIELYSGIFAFGDSLYYEAKYFESECELAKNNASASIDILEDLLKDGNTNILVLERVLIRLGQVYCVTGNKSKAFNLFIRLKKEFPRSIYIPLANCESVGK